MDFYFLFKHFLIVSSFIPLQKKIFNNNLRSIKIVTESKRNSSSGIQNSSPIVTSFTNEVVIWFVTDKTGTGQGWKFHYEAVE